MKHLPALDGVRSLAILLVLFHQFDVLDGPLPLAARIIDPFFQVGWVGVTLFFVLSGFLITGILLDTKGRPGWLRAFYARRALRIFPLFTYAVLVVAFVVLPALGIATTGDNQVWFWTYLANWTSGRSEPRFSHFWSLCVEEQFYILWPLVVAALGRRALTATCGLLIAVALAVRCVLALGGHAGMAYAFTVCRMDALAAGALLAIALRTPDVRATLERWLRPLAAAALALSVGVGLATHALPRTSPWTLTVGYLVLDVDFALVVLAGSLGRPAVLRAKPLRVLGKYSYAMYMFHLPLQLLLGVRLQTFVLAGGAAHIVIGQILYLAGMTAAVLGLAWISWNLLEKPVLGLKRHFDV